MSITQQKQDLREIIHKRIEEYLEANPNEATEVAMGAMRRLSGKMTLKELQQWHHTLYMPELISAEGEG